MSDCWAADGARGKSTSDNICQTSFAVECLGEYCQYLHHGEPLFRTVGNAKDKLLEITNEKWGKASPAVGRACGRDCGG